MAAEKTTDKQQSKAGTETSVISDGLLPVIRYLVVMLLLGAFVLFPILRNKEATWSPQVQVVNVTSSQVTPHQEVPTIVPPELESEEPTKLTGFDTESAAQVAQTVASGCSDELAVKKGCALTLQKDVWSEKICKTSDAPEKQRLETFPTGGCVQVLLYRFRDDPNPVKTEDCKGVAVNFEQVLGGMPVVCAQFAAGSTNQMRVELNRRFIR